MQIHGSREKSSHGARRLVSLNRVFYCDNDDGHYVKGKINYRHMQLNAPPAL